MGADGGVPPGTGVSPAFSFPNTAVKFHPGDLLLQAALGRGGKAQEKVLEHVLQCTRCLGRLTDLPPGYDLAFERAHQAFELRQVVLGRERAEAPGLLAFLIGLPPGRRDLVLRNSARFQSWGLFELLIREGREETFRDTRHAEEILHLALEVSDYLDADYYGKALLEDMRARTWGYIANARRARMELGEAESTFEAAFERLRWGTGEPMDRAILLDLKASLVRDQHLYSESLGLSRRAIAIFSRLGERHWTGRCMVNQSIVYRFTGHPMEAIRLLYQSLDLIDRKREPRLVLCALNNLAEDLAFAGRSMEAQRELAKAAPLYQKFSEPMMQARRLWVEALVARSLGHLRKAEELLRQAEAGVAVAGTASDWELISRDMASLNTLPRR